MKTSKRILLTAFVLAAASNLTAEDLRVKLDPKSPGRVFEGVGAVSAGATSALLRDYPEPYRSDVLDFLFKPQFGASFQHLKVEIGSGMNSTCGAEPSHAINPEELANPVPRGYELWLAAEARKRNPDIILDALPWGTPYWTGGYTTPEAAKWVVAFLDAANKHWRLDFNYVGGYRNECRPPESDKARTFIVEHLRPALDRAGYKNVQLPAGFLESGMRFWSSEDFSNDGKFRLGWHYIRSIIREYDELRMTKSEAWAPFSSLPAGIKWNNVGFIDASACRNGHYEVKPALWCVAHVTQFAQPGWKFMDSAQGRIEKDKLGGVFTTLRDPKGKDWSLIAATWKPVTLEIEIDPALAGGPVAVWKSNEAEQFRKIDMLKPEGGKLRVALEGGSSLYTLSTTTGQIKGQPPHPIPPKQPGGPWQDDFQNYKEHDSPHYWIDQEGTFEVVTDDGRKVLKQVVPKRGTVWGLSYGSCWSSYGGTDRVRAMKIATAVQVRKGFVEIGAGADAERTLRFQLHDNGKWKLLHKDSTVLKEGEAASFHSNKTCRLSFELDARPGKPSRVTCAINGSECHSGEVPRKDNKPEKMDAGLLPLIGSSYDPNLFESVEVAPVP
ncbi:MAG: hypothetical protein NTV49_13785 [Kiritimatiellaeota bacterium]|nr:hypothetical protein [Kiritimatiellota bacterium]